MTTEPRKRKKMIPIPFEAEVIARMDFLIQAQNPMIRNRTHWVSVYVPRMMEQIEKELTESMNIQTRK